MKNIYDESNEYRINVEVSSVDEAQEVVKKIEEIRNEHDVFIQANIDVVTCAVNRK